MRTYPLKDGDTLVFSVNGGEWETVTFESGSFANIGEATAEELSQVLGRSGSLAARADERQRLVIETATAGGHTSLEIDTERSTAAPKLGLGAELAGAQGSGLRAAQLVSLAAEPFPLAEGSELTLVIDDQRRKVGFDEGFAPGKASAADVVKIINAKKKKVAVVTKDGRVSITSPTVGAGSSVAVEPAPPERVDAAAALGFVGASAFDQPHQVAPARLVCAGRRAGGLQVVNLTAGPIEIHLAAGPTLLPARGGAPLSPGDAANSQLQKLVEQGVVRLAPAEPAGEGDAGSSE